MARRRAQLSPFLSFGGGDDGSDCHSDETLRENEQKRAERSINITLWVGDDCQQKWTRRVQRSPPLNARLIVLLLLVPHIAASLDA